MQEEQGPSSEYIKGFNQMYKLKSEMSDVVNQLLSTKTDGDRFKGMVAGAKQFELERIREISKNSRDQSREREI